MKLKDAFPEVHKVLEDKLKKIKAVEVPIAPLPRPKVHRVGTRLYKNNRKTCLVKGGKRWDSLRRILSEKRKEN